MTNKKELMKEILRFLLVGGLATLVDFGIYELCRFVLFTGLSKNLNLILSTSLGFIFGVLGLMPRNWIDDVEPEWKVKLENVKGLK